MRNNIWEMVSKFNEAIQCFFYMSCVVIAQQNLVYHRDVFDSTSARYDRPIAAALIPL